MARAAYTREYVRGQTAVAIAQQATQAYLAFARGCVPFSAVVLLPRQLYGGGPPTNTAIVPSHDVQYAAIACTQG